MKKGARRIGKGWKYRVTALAAVIFIVGSSLTTVYAAEEDGLESTVEKEGQGMGLDREGSPDLIKSMWKDISAGGRDEGRGDGIGEMSSGLKPPKMRNQAYGRKKKRNSETERWTPYFVDNAVFVGGSIMLGFQIMP